MLPIRIVLNVVYAMLTEHLDGDDREAFDARLYGLDEVDAQANRRLQQAMRGGGGEQ